MDKEMQNKLIHSVAVTRKLIDEEKNRTNPDQQYIEDMERDLDWMINKIDELVED